MNSKQDFGSIDESNDAWIRLKDDLKEWECAHPTDQFISPKAFTKRFTLSMNASQNKVLVKRIISFWRKDVSCGCQLPMA